MKTILLVEDDPVVRMSLRRRLMNNGYDVLEASSLERARETLRAHSSSIAVVVSDTNLRDGDSPELHAELEHEGFFTLHKIGWVSITGEAFPHQIAYFENRGIAVIKKPLNMIELLAAIEAASRRPT